MRSTNHLLGAQQSCDCGAAGARHPVAMSWDCARLALSEEQRGGLLCHRLRRDFDLSAALGQTVLEARAGERIDILEIPLRASGPGTQGNSPRQCVMARPTESGVAHGAHLRVAGPAGGEGSHDCPTVAATPGMTTRGMPEPKPCVIFGRSMTQSCPDHDGGDLLAITGALVLGPGARMSTWRARGRVRRRGRAQLSRLRSQALAPCG